MTHTEKMIEKYAEELANALTSDLNKACKILTKIFRYATITDAIEVYDDLIVPVIYHSVLEDCFHSCSLVLKGTQLGKGDAWGRLSGIMETLHYDNGLPLSGYNYPADNPTEWNDYFEHYDRDQDFWGFYCSDTIYNFVTDGTNIFIRVDLSLSELRDELTNMYDGASWDHDFNRGW